MKGLLIYASLILIPLVLMGSCTNKTEYKTLTVNAGLVHFSFEYSTYYKLEEPDIWKNCTDVLFRHGSDRENYTRITIEALVPAYYHLADAHALFDGDIKSANTIFLGEANNRFELVEQSEPKIDGVEAQGIVYKCRDSVLSAFEKQDVYNIYRSIYFDRDGLIWRFQVISDPSVADIDKAGFDHIVETFKFLP